MSTPTDPMISLRGLTRHFGRVRAVQELDLDVQAGELFCFLGPNGAGKTTTIKMMTGLLRPTRGTAHIAGLDIQQAPQEAKQLMGYIPDMPYLYERLTCREFYAFTGDLYNVPHATVEERVGPALEQFGLTEYTHTLTKDLSHGLRQRLIYAATFLHDPRVLFIDEPLIGLDPKTIRMIKDLLRRKTQSGMTIFLTTHILALAEDIADRIAIISQGRVAAIGTMAELRTAAGVEGSLEDVFLKLTDEDVAP